MFGKLKVVAKAMILAFGLPNQKWAQIISFALFLGIIALGIWTFYCDKRSTIGSFFLSVLLLSLLMLVLITQPLYLYFRYFLVCFPFFYFLLSHLLGKLYRTSIQGKVLSVLLISLLIFCHSARTKLLLTDGRGNYSQALEDIFTATDGSLVKVATDHDFRNKMVFTFYSRFLPEN